MLWLYWVYWISNGYEDNDSNQEVLRVLYCGSMNGMDVYD
jgi:hypothetical protein